LEIRLRQLMHNYLKNAPAELHPDPIRTIRNDGALDFWIRLKSHWGRPNKKNKMS